ELRSRRPARPRLFSADVDDVRAVREHPTHVIERGGPVEKTAAIEERIGRDVEHAHDQGAVEREAESATAQIALHGAYFGEHGHRLPGAKEPMLNRGG